MIVVARPRAAGRPGSVRWSNLVSSVPHHRPVGWESYVKASLLDQLVSLVRYDDTARSSARAKILAAATGAIGLCYRVGDLELPLRAETTARGAEQMELVAEYLCKVK